MPLVAEAATDRVRRPGKVARGPHYPFSKTGHGIGIGRDPVPRHVRLHASRGFARGCGRKQRGRGSATGVVSPKPLSRNGCLLVIGWATWCHRLGGNFGGNLRDSLGGDRPLRDTRRLIRRVRLPVSRLRQCILFLRRKTSLGPPDRSPASPPPVRVSVIEVSFRACLTGSARSAPGCGKQFPCPDFGLRLGTRPVIRTLEPLDVDWPCAVAASDDRLGRMG